MTFKKSRPAHRAATDIAAIVAADALDLAALIRDGAIDVVPGHPPVPINVWRIADLDRNDDMSHGMSPTLAALVVGLYTDPRDTLVDFDADPTLEGAAGAGGCRYLPVRGPANLADLDPVAGKTKLITLRWPNPADPTRALADRAELDDMFAACRTLLAPDGAAIVALAPPPPGQPAMEHTHEVVPAAYQAGLGYLQHIIVVKAPIRGERPTNLTTPAGRATLRAARHPAQHQRIHNDLLLFVLPQLPVGPGKLTDSQREPRRRSRGARRRAPRSPR